MRSRDKLKKLYLTFIRLMTTAVWKVSKCAVFFGPYFPMFGLNTEIYSVNLRIQSDYEKIWTRKSSVFENFSRIPLNLAGYWLKGGGTERKRQSRHWLFAKLLCSFQFSIPRSSSTLITPSWSASSIAQVKLYPPNSVTFFLCCLQNISCLYQSSLTGMNVHF